MLLLTGCLAKDLNKTVVTQIDLPPVPEFLSYEVATELSKVCNPWSKCEAIESFNNQYERFILKYEVYCRSYKSIK